MRKYFLLNCKRTLALLPRVLLGVVCVALVLGLLLGAVLAQNSLEQGARLSIALVGTTDDPILEMGLAALQSLDSTRYTVDIAALTEQEAQQAMQAGSIAAYAVIPEGFTHEAGYGHFLPIELVTDTGAADLVSIFKTEVTQVLTDILAEARKGVFGVADALDEAGLPSHKPMNQLAVEYVEFILVRDRTYQVEVLGIGDGLGLEKYMLCALSVLLLGLTCLPFGTVLLLRDMALPRLLAARGVGAFGQTLCEFGAFYLVLLIPGLWLAATGIGVLAVLAATFCLCAVSYLLYQLAADLISGTVLQFLLFAAMAFISGCMYPVYFFPAGLQKLAGWLPTGMARLCLSGSLTGKEAYAGVLLWGIFALGLSVAVRRLRLKGVRP